MPSKWAVITGASKGIGRATALLSTKLGFYVIANGRNKSELNSLQKEAESFEGKIHVVPADISTDIGIQELFSFIKRNTEQIDLLVHSAGIAHVGMVSDMPVEKWREMLEINLSVPFAITQNCLPMMKAVSQIVFINSVGGRITFKEWSGYCASKFGLRALADALRDELRERRIRITSIYPASVDTPMHDQLPYDWSREKMLHADNVAQAIMFCYNQDENVVIKEMDLENNAGTF